MNHQTKAYVSCLALDAALLAYFYIAVLPFHPEQIPNYGAFFVMLNAIIVGTTFGIKPIQMVDPMRQQTQGQQQVEHIPPPKYSAGLCEECGTPTGKARFCPNCGTPVKGVGPRQMAPKMDDTELSVTMVPVTIEGTAYVPQGQLQQIKITKVKMGKNVQSAESHEESNPEPRPMRNKKVKPIPVVQQPPIPPVDDSPMEKDIYEPRS